MLAPKAIGAHQRLCKRSLTVCCVADRTLITIASANRPGTLVEVVQGLTELGLDVHRARISSDGGWFVDGESTAVLAMLGSHKQTFSAIQQ